MKPPTSALDKNGNLIVTRPDAHAGHADHAV